MSRTSLYIRLHLMNGSMTEFSNVISAVVDKDYYLPYTKLSASVIIPEGVSLSVNQVKRIEFWYGGKRLHRGFSDRMKILKTGSLRTLEVFSRGVTAGICQSESEPGIWSQVDLGDVVTRCRTTTEILYETGTDKVNYVYILENQSSWDAVCAYALKAYSRYPYIYSTGTVRVTKSSAVRNVNNPVILSSGTSLDTMRLLTKLYMLDLSDEYSYSAEDTFAQNFGIQREKYLPFDKQWLQDEEEGLRMRLKYSRRASRAYQLRYVGYNDEDITDKVNITGAGSLSAQLTVGAVRISFGPLGVETTLTEYNDGFLP